MDVGSQLREYISRSVDELTLLLSSPPSAPSPFRVNVLDLLNAYPEAAHCLINQPSMWLPILKQTVIDAQQQLILVLPPSHSNNPMKIKNNPLISVHSLPPTPSLQKKTIACIQNNDVDKIIEISGTVVRTSAVKMLELARVYRCMRPSCGRSIRVMADPEQDHLIEAPPQCPAVAADGSICNGRHMREIEGSKECIDCQECRLQDRMDTLPFGAVPRSIALLLQDCLVDTLNPGDDVLVTGVLFRQWRPVRAGVKCEATMALRALSVKALNGLCSFRIFSSAIECRLQLESFWASYRLRPLAGRDRLLSQVCPQLYGMYLVKLAVLLTVLGGASTVRRDGVQSRSNCHLLLVGDPGTGKSQLLAFAAALTPRSLQTTGVGTTGAGLTCTAIRTGSEWSLEAGALVLASGGVCCIDEFTSMRESDRTTIHEAMEQQTISVAKAGLLVKLETKTTIIAACNPKGSYDPALDLTANTLIGPALLSRFDLILVLLDRPNKEWDKRVSTYLLKQAVGSTLPNDNFQSSEETKQYSFLREYVMYVREGIDPIMCAGAKTLLTRYYHMQRQSDESAARTTVRLLESLLRLSEAHAKLMFRSVVTFQDAVIAISLTQLSYTASKASLLSTDSMLQSDFPDDPDSFYSAQERDVVRRLHLSLADVEEMKSNVRIDSKIPAVSRDFNTKLPACEFSMNSLPLNQLDNVSEVYSQSKEFDCSHIVVVDPVTSLTSKLFTAQAENSFRLDSAMEDW